MYGRRRISAALCAALLAVGVPSCGRADSVSHADVSSAADVKAAENGTAGRYVCPDDGSTFVVADCGGGSYQAELVLFRMAAIDDLAGTYRDGVLAMSGTDPAGGAVTIEAVFQDGQAVVSVPDSMWEYFADGTARYVFDREPE